jgi:TP901-1 family phage major tail protein
MANGDAKAGRLFIIKIGDGGGPEVFTAIGGLKASSIKLGAEQIDVTDQASVDWRQLLSGYGIKQVTISGTGIYRNDTYEQLLRTKFLANLTWNYQLIDQDGHIWSGSFMIKDLEYKGDDKSPETYQFSLSSNGAVSYAN